MDWACSECGGIVHPKKGPKGWYAYWCVCGVHVTVKPGSTTFEKLEKANQ